MARKWLAADVKHSLDSFGGLREAAERILGHVRRGAKITVHGDYDADGVCSTAILLRALSSLGAQPDWYLPCRIADGYGLATATVEKLAERGTQVLITADCAITAVEPVLRAKELGVEVIVTDHHAPRADGELPDAPIVHPRLGGYPCPDLCAAGVAHLLAKALLEAAGRDPALADEDLDLVALATVADVVPLRDENRRLVKQGLRALAATRKPGLRALMEVSRVDPSTLDTSSIGFRLAPRINAAGRLYRADAGLELVLCPDPERAREIARELDAVNRERQDVETRIRFEAEAQAAEHGDQAAYVLAAEGWHPGVVGIVAARIAERYHRPAVLIALDRETGEGTGSGRSIPAFDLLAGLTAGSAHLLRYGGHRAAAGLSITAGNVDAFRTAFAAHAADVLEPTDLLPRDRVDAVVSGDQLGLGLIEELDRLGPFGQGNPPVSLLVPGASLSDARPLGDSGRHLRCMLSAGGARSSAVCFGTGTTLPVTPETPVDAVIRLEADRWNGSVAPRVVIRRVREATGGAIDLLGEPTSEEWLAVALAELDAPLDAPPLPARVPGRRERDATNQGAAGTIGDLLATGDRVLIVAAHAATRARQLAQRGQGGFALTSWTALERRPELAEPYTHVIALDPPAVAHQQAVAVRATGPGWLHHAHGKPERDLAIAVHRWEYDLREPLAELYRALKQEPADLTMTLRGSGKTPRTAVLAGRMIRVLYELELVSVRPGPMLTLGAPAQRTALERSEAFRAYQTRLEDGTRFLTQTPLPIAA